MGREIAVLGAGSWGTALAISLAGSGHRVTLWASRPVAAACMRAERHNPRLTGAKLLVETGAVSLDATGATVRSGPETYRVRTTDGALHCTCQWWAKYRGGRGPCKHALATELARADAPAVAR